MNKSIVSIDTIKYIIIYLIKLILMFVVYIYDIKANNKKEFNRVKRRFYYYLNKIFNTPIGNNIHFLSKSVIFASLNAEVELDALFKDILMYSDTLFVHKLYTSNIKQLE